MDLRKQLERLTGEQLQDIAEFAAQLLQQQGAAVPEHAAGN